MPMPRPGQPAEVGAGQGLLASDDASIAGQIVPIYGGAVVNG